MAAPPYQALTLKANGRLSQLISDLQVSAVFDPNSRPNPLPDKVATKALWDTGASKSVISQALAKQLNLVPTGATNVVHAGGASVSPTHIVNFYLPNSVAITGVVVTEFPGTGNFGAIIGMDVISLGDFSVTNFSGHTWMSFRIPSQNQVDYVQEHRRTSYAGTGRNEKCPCGSGEKFKRCHGK